MDRYTFINRILEKIERQNIIHLFKQGINEKEIASDLNISQRYVEKIIDKYQAKYGELVREDSNVAEYILEGNTN